MEPLNNEEEETGPGNKSGREKGKVEIKNLLY